MGLFTSEKTKQERAKKEAEQAKAKAAEERKEKQKAETEGKIASAYARQVEAAKKAEIEEEKLKLKEKELLMKMSPEEREAYLKNIQEAKISEIDALNKLQYEKKLKQIELQEKEFQLQKEKEDRELQIKREQEEKLKIQREQRARILKKISLPAAVLIILSIVIYVIYFFIKKSSYEDLVNFTNTHLIMPVDTNISGNLNSSISVVNNNCKFIVRKDEKEITEEKGFIKKRQVVVGKEEIINIFFTVNIRVNNVPKDENGKKIDENKLRNSKFSIAFYDKDKTPISFNNEFEYLYKSDLNQLLTTKGSEFTIDFVNREIDINEFKKIIEKIKYFRVVANYNLNY